MKSKRDINVDLRFIIRRADSLFELLSHIELSITFDYILNAPPVPEFFDSPNYS